MSSYQNIRVSTEDHQAWITINRPDTLNALDVQTIEEIESAFMAAEADDDARVPSVSAIAASTTL